MGFEINTDDMFSYRNRSFEELVYVHDDMSLMGFLKKYNLTKDINIFEEYIDHNFINNFRLILVENKYHVNYVDCFKSGYKFYSDKIKTNIRNREISLDNQPYLNLILSKLNNLVIESLNEQQVRFSIKEVKTTTNKPISRVIESYFILNENYIFESKNLTDGLKNKNKFIHNKTKVLSVENFFKPDNKGTIDWIGGKDKLGMFVFLLKKKGIIKNECHFKVAKILFKLDGKEIKSLTSPKKEDAIGYVSKIEKLIDNNFILKKK